MPTYEYRCPAGHEFEQFQRITDPAMARCPECGADAERLLSAGAGLIFRGSGFYLTDYRSESYRKAAEADAKAANGSSSKASDSASSSSSSAAKSSGSNGGSAAGA